MLRSHFLVPLVAVIFLFSSCKKDVEIKPVDSTVPSVPTPTTPPISTVIVNKDTGSVVFDFKAIVNGLALSANFFNYKNAKGDSFSVSKFNYYIAGIKLKNENGTVFAERESYHLNKHVDGKEVFTITGVPAGTYTAIDFIIGVDSLRNVSGVQGGALDVKEDMFWDWNSGYIFFKLEGEYKAPNSNNLMPYGMHIGGFSGNNSNIQKCSIALSTKLITQKGGTSKVFFHTSIDEIFNNPNIIDLESFAVIANDKVGRILARNYKDMFTVYKIEN